MKTTVKNAILSHLSDAQQNNISPDEANNHINFAKYLLNKYPTPAALTSDELDADWDDMIINQRCVVRIGSLKVGDRFIVHTGTYAGDIGELVMAEPGGKHLFEAESVQIAVSHLFPVIKIAKS